MKLAIGCDEAACELKEVLKKHLLEQGHDVTDFGTHDAKPVLYPDVAIAVAERVAKGEYPRAVLLCGTGIGMAISANKVTGIRAAQCHDTYSAERAARRNRWRATSLPRNAELIPFSATLMRRFVSKAL